MSVSLGIDDEEWNFESIAVLVDGDDKWYYQSAATKTKYNRNNFRRIIYQDDDIENK